MTRSSLIYLLFLYIIVSLAACANKPKGTSREALLWEQQVDTSLIAVIPYTGEWGTGGKNNTPASLTMDDMKKIEFLLQSCVSRNKDVDLKREKYRRQYIAMTNDKGEKIVWINCFCGVDNDNWRNSIVMVHDGGSCYFNLKVNLTKGVYYDFWVNGYA